ncbi:L-histidine carboxy-lyase (histamine-forming) [Streptomyces sp. BK208]|uniref:histidine decarboxylase n=1 Tax=Streptomyces sp. BK208 TaxID=2512150 RepID=UPI00105BB493|nr:histidine decarboxylase [Streptomyces sp. BK208]TDT25912.1 L-histidine carboxy-lyase (histamine-forming) [Streptomyces sp. BK208]
MKPTVADADLTIGGLPRTADELKADRTMLEEMADEMYRARDHMVGFPVNLEFDYRHLARYLAVHGNNAGSPYGSTDYHLHSKRFERAVVGFFADLAGAPSDEVFGYVSNGGTESNIFGVYVGRERFPDAVLYASAQAHYSIPKIARLLRMQYEPVATDAEGAMDTDVLRTALSQHGTRAAVVVATIGTTGRGAVDALPGVQRALTEAGTCRAHVHADAAFGGLLAALGPRPAPWGFSDGADSVAISGHKMIGSPIPCGIVLARHRHVETVRVHDAAVGADDDTISGSRDALSPVILWQELRRLGRQGLAQRVHGCLRTAEYAEKRLRECGMRPERPHRNTTVLFDAPQQDVCDRWNLLHVEGRTHLITMPHVTEADIDRLCADIARTERRRRVTTSPPPSP